MKHLVCLRLHSGSYFCRDSAHAGKGPGTFPGFSLIIASVVATTITGGGVRSLLLQWGGDMAVGLVVGVEVGAIQATGSVIEGGRIAENA